MNRIEISSLSNCLNQEINSYYLVTEKDLRQGAKDYYLRLKLADKSGFIVGNMWRNVAGVTTTFKAGDVIFIKAVVIKYQKNLQLNINEIHLLKNDQYDIGELVPKTNKDMTQLTDDFFALIDSINNPFLNKLLNNIFANKAFLDKFLNAPAAKTWHHNYAGGLLEHSLTVAKICDFTSKLYNADRDLLLCGALLHDIGKVNEYEYVIGINFSDEGRLLGHLVMGDKLITDHASKIDLFPKDILLKLRHMILSHHGEFDKGSCREPQTIEANLLHFADNMDAQTIGISQVINASADNSKWSEFDKLNQKFYFKG